jgi:hypothetical protein
VFILSIVAAVSSSSYRQLVLCAENPALLDACRQPGETLEKQWMNASVAESEWAALCLLQHHDTYLQTDKNHCKSRPIDALKRQSCSRLDLLTSEHVGLLPTTGDFRQPLVCKSASQVAQQGDSPHHVTSNRNSQPAL